MISLDYSYSGQKEVYLQLLKSIPKGKYFDNRADIVPVEDISEFRVVTDFVGEIHYVSIVCENGQNKTFTFVPDSKYYALSVSLPHGLNTITVYYSDEEYCTKSYCNTYFGTFIFAYAKELNLATTRLDRLNRDIYKQEATRITSPVQRYAENLTDKKHLRIFGLQLITRALINAQGTFESLEDICKAVYISTPIIEDVETKDVFDLEYYSFAGQEYELGKVLYLWVRNPALVRKLYGLILANNFNIDVSVSDSTLETDDGINQYEDSDSPIIVDENGYTEYDYGTDDDLKPDGYLDIEVSIDIDLPRLDRNLPIPFIDKYPWYDGNNYEDRDHLDEGKSLDIATWLDPFNKGMLGKQFIPYRYDGSKVTSLLKVIKISMISVNASTSNALDIRNYTTSYLWRNDVDELIEDDDENIFEFYDPDRDPVTILSDDENSLIVGSDGDVIELHE